jgi:hypothetical protein
MDLDTFVTTLYVRIDDWYKAELGVLMARPKGAAQQMSDSEVLTVAVAGQWRVGVPWYSERSLVRYMQRAGRQWFPGMLGRSQFNLRVRQLWGALVRLQQLLAEELRSPEDCYESVDCVPVRACSLAQAVKGSHWLWASRFGRGGNEGQWFYGEQLLSAVLPHSGAVTGWLLGPADLDDRWLMEAFVSQRQGERRLWGPGPDPHQSRQRWQRPEQPLLGPHASVGSGNPRPYLADGGFNGPRWSQHWQQSYLATVLTAPPDHAPRRWSWPWKAWLAHHRQIVETVFARLNDVFGLQRLRAHSRWGQSTRLAAVMAAYNFGLWLNRLLGRPYGALPTLLL